MTTTAKPRTARPEGVLQVALSADLSGPVSEPALGELSHPARRVPATATMASVDLLFRRDAALRWIVVDAPGAPQLVSRSWFELAMTGRLGYGRLLLQRRPVTDSAPPATLRFAADCPVATVAAAVIERRSGGDALLDAVLVTWPDGRLAVASVTAVFEQLSQRYAYQALHDPLTRLPNRLFLLERLR